MVQGKNFELKRNDGDVLTGYKIPANFIISIKDNHCCYKRISFLFSSTTQLSIIPLFNYKGVLYFHSIIFLQPTYKNI